ncbi:MAG: formate acetyltransferase, partial [Candidatus Pacebacteria bacterium]|nr:formate acetyltransferase [Candidatus Paceibacterota bacterium]
MNTIAWKTFTPGPWRERPDVRDFIVRNFTPYTGTASFLADPTDRTRAVLGAFQKLRAQEQERGGVLDIDTSTVSSLLTYGPGYLDQDNELIVGLQTDAPLKRGVNPFGGLRMARKACEAYGYQLDEDIEKGFQYRTTHNDGVYRIYTEGMRAARRCGVITGLPDAYGRGRIIGDYRRVALYGVDQLIAWKKDHKAELGRQPMTEDVIRRSEELWREIDFLEKLKRMAELYGHDISAPARTAHEAIQWVYFAYLGAIKEQNGAAMSLGRVSTFLDIYVERDIATQQIDESKAQELIDDFVLKLRMARQLRTPEYNDLFAGDPTWVTEAIGGVAEDGRPLVTKTSFRFLHTLENLGPAPEPNLTVLWAPELPDGFREYCAQLSIDTDTIQYENDPLMRKLYGDDYGIACCVSAMKIGKQMQFFGARCNLPKILLMALNGGRDEISGEQVGPEMPVMNDDILDFSTVMKRFRHYRAWLAELYVN